MVEVELTPAEVRPIGLSWTPQMVERSRRSAGATIEACCAALEEGIGVDLDAGTRHAFRDQGEGYCVFNDSAIVALAMQAEVESGESQSLIAMCIRANFAVWPACRRDRDGRWYAGTIAVTVDIHFRTVQVAAHLARGAQHSHAPCLQ